MFHLYKPLEEGKEICYYVDMRKMSTDEFRVLYQILGSPTSHSQFESKNVFEVGPRLSWITPWSSTVREILQNCDIRSPFKIEYSIRSNQPFEYDKMTKEIYPSPLETLESTIEIKDNSKEEIDPQSANRKYNLGFDTQDFHFLRDIFRDRNPRLIELFDLAQSNSEHCRHHFFRGKLTIDSIPCKHSLFDLVKRPYNLTQHGTIAFSDNASALPGLEIKRLSLSLHMENQILHPTFTAETHNFPTGICPYEGAATGVGGRQRDNQSIGRGGELLAGTAGYCVGNLGFLPWEKNTGSGHMASPLKILIEASNGVSDYGNRFGEPLIQGFTRTFQLGDRGWIKPILFSGGVGQIRKEWLHKEIRENLYVMKIGGPAYRIGIGGGTASSRTEIKDDDFNAVQRGDPLMNQKIYRVIQTCTSLSTNPILSISDQGAGGNANVLKEIVSPMGAEIFIDLLMTGDSTMTPLELWIAEYQESHAILTDNAQSLFIICARENVPCCIIGRVTNTGRMVAQYNGETMVDLNLNKTVENVPRKTFHTFRHEKTSIPLLLPLLSPMMFFSRVLRLPSVGSKRFLTVKCDRSVGGLVVQQQCVGPLETPVSNVAVTAQGFFTDNGIALSIGERPLLSLIDPRKMARMAVAESLTNLVWASISTGINCSGNWMWPGKNADLIDAVEALSDMLTEIGLTLDGGKDSLSMVANSVKAPGSLVVSCYSNCTINRVITPVLSPNGESIYLLTLGTPKTRMGGSALEQVCSQIGSECPDVDSVSALKELFNYIQKIHSSIIAGHDRSDGGLATCLLEMCLAGNCGLEIDESYSIPFLFNEEVGVVIQTNDELKNVPFNVSVQYLGKSVKEDRFYIKSFIETKVSNLRDLWESTSFVLDSKQSNPVTVYQEKEGMRCRKNPEYKVSFPPLTIQESLFKPCVAVIRTDGTNGHREMSAAFHSVGFEVIDVHTNDLKKDPKLLENCRGIAFPGGFSFSDILGVSKGEAMIFKYCKEIKQAIDNFYNRKNTFSLGVCNGFQLMTQLGLFGDVSLTKNDSTRFECRYSTIRIRKSNSIFLKGMEGSILPIWIAHSEGKFCGDYPSVIDYVNDDGKTTDLYPFSPNGSSTAGISSKDGRHLGMMPHPERCFKPWQLPWNPNEWKVSPWLRMFENVYNWCISN